ncbi:tRNA pseudouridine65 synthase [Sphingobacterium allocomposti]|jgi:tRNA pseudouridine65 synthase|uniref:tRNA pseudouridine65 synthase n=1 Tax=Sphingobacterium allocomposti TaxID=415956 RepID=A0A5S5DAW1_9SPHI|nr:pseudouridine synthase [Sphingobacterium composti Yoo et al. 2007 non Ten et al. 2007]TYP91759.1 tRNA pseudouridine65 synthase [Sphingobacterium composti Yoo et al. 2007 non Ten et al. 2007]HLS93943.1 pseudouridine synthase [Sphingobacterium sp.]
MLEILYQDTDLIAINKPHGLLVHRSSIASDTSEYALQLLRNQIQQTVYPAHRLDRKTGGVLLFTLNKEMDSLTQQLFAGKDVHKTYWAVVRGYTEDEGTIDYPLRKENGVLQDAVTHFRTLHRTEIPLPFGKHQTSRYSLVEATPITGRMHQIRKHLAHIFHPIIADRPHGCNKQNKLWKDRFQLDTMMLHAKTLAFHHPRTQERIAIHAPLQPDFVRVLTLLNIPL